MMLKQLLIFKLALCLFMPFSTLAATVAGSIERLEGVATLNSQGTQKIAQVNMRLYQGDQIVTTDQTELLVRMTDGTVIAMRPNSNLTVASYAFDPANSAQDSILIKLIKGGFRTVTGAIGRKNPQKVYFVTPAATIGIRGTDFEVAVLENKKADAEAGTYNKVFDGATYIQNNHGGQIEVGPNQAAFSPMNALQIANQFGLLKQVPNVFFNGQYDNLLDALR